MILRCFFFFFFFPGHAVYICYWNQWPQMLVMLQTHGGLSWDGWKCTGLAIGISGSGPATSVPISHQERYFIWNPWPHSIIKVTLSYHHSHYIAGRQRFTVSKTITHGWQMVDIRKLSIPDPKHLLFSLSQAILFTEDSWDKYLTSLSLT